MALKSIHIRLEFNLIGGGVGGGNVGGLVGRGGISGSGVLLGVTGVGDISDVTVVAIGLVGDGLDATIGKSNVVRARNVTVTIAGLLVAHVVVIVVLHVIREAVGKGGL